ncbi:tyrosine-type recombinase/integrase [Reyranella sp.]|uniref:tyrosine-type recombinase/integrase n=1 Tax=Reyranella sp. TaxID=1929291 RepID=UPI0037847D19
MARTIERLKPLTVQREGKPGLYPDGGGLHLQVSASGSKSWVFRYELRGRRREMGLGSMNDVSLAEARALARAARGVKATGVDPIAHRDAQRAAARLEEARTITFAAAAADYIAANKAGWRNAKHADQWTATLKTYAYPVLGKLAVGDVDTGLVVRVLQPIWATKPETASRVRGRIEAVLDYAKSQGYRAGDNPARWAGHLKLQLPARGKVRRVEHHAALPYAQVPAFVAALGEQPGLAALALRLLILTAARTGEIINAQWSEIDHERGLWTIPAGRMKAEREHRVPLSRAALDLLDVIAGHRATLADGSPGPWLFAGARGKAMSNGGMLALLKRMKRTDITPHGFRSSFRDWAAEKTTFPPEVAELALAHTVGSKVELAYRRSDLFDRRRQLAEAWSSFCMKSNGVTPIADRGRA